MTTYVEVSTLAVARRERVTDGRTSMLWSQFTNVTDGQTDRQTTCDSNTALCTKVHRAVKNTLLTQDTPKCTFRANTSDCFNSDNWNIRIRMMQTVSSVWSISTPIGPIDCRPYHITSIIVCQSYCMVASLRLTTSIKGICYVMLCYVLGRGTCHYPQCPLAMPMGLWRLR